MLKCPKNRWAWYLTRVRSERETSMIIDQPPPKKPSFWKRQVSEDDTGVQRTFDVIFGAILPVVLFVLDPVAMNGFGCVGGAAAPYSAFVYFAVAFGIISLLVWLFARPYIDSFAPVLAGVVYAGGFFAGAIGVLMLPISIMGLVILIGALGFLPFVVAYVYFRNAVRAYRLAKSQEAVKYRLAALMLAGTVVVLGIPGLIQL